ncbi:MAG: hypothetical protein M1812_002200 [Candelaria pacifica]|nr:MAG: hypothetical protein M1812_002200 [Candelaria pacifica]
MGKHKKRKLERKPRKSSKKTAQGTSKQSTPSIKKTQLLQHSAPTIPFNVEDRILLVGEGDFSFSHSLISRHGCTSVLGTCYDSEMELFRKYPQAKENINYLLQEGQKVLYDTDAKRLDKKEIKKIAQFNKVVFNFPHVGGLTKDVNRQVRHNQELLVGFFMAALPLLAPGGAIIVTIFDGEPYTLWNIKDLARHVGLKVGRSFRFQSSAYPGYKHSRTLGNIDGGGAWQGGNRSARTYIFDVNDLSDVSQSTGSKRKKKGYENSSDEDDPRSQNLH